MLKNSCKFSFSSPITTPQLRGIGTPCFLFCTILELLERQADNIHIRIVNLLGFGLGLAWVCLPARREAFRRRPKIQICGSRDCRTNCTEPYKLFHRFLASTLFASSLLHPFLGKAYHTYSRIVPYRGRLCLN